MKRSHPILSISKEQLITLWILFPVTMPKNRQVHGALSIHVDDLLMTGDDVFEKEIMGRLRKDFQVGSEDKNDCLFVGQRIQVGTSMSAHSTNAYCIRKCPRSDQLVTIANAVPHWLSNLQVCIQGIIT